MKLVKIEWVDANFSDGWVSKTKARTHQLAQCTTVGFVVKKNFKQITVAQSISNDNSFDSIMSIPIKCVKSIKDIQ